MAKAIMTSPTIDHGAVAALIEPLTDLVARAGQAVLAINRTIMTVDGKSDGSPVTEADLAADRVIAEGLAELAPQIPALSEERLHAGNPPYRDAFFLIDPLDGTKEFVAGRDEFTINLALVVGGQPLLGIVGAPALRRIWRGMVGHGAERLVLTADGSVERREPIKTRIWPGQDRPWIVAVSRSHGDHRTEAFIDARSGATRQMLGSAIKFCRVAEGGADIYPRLAPTCEWDVAAGHAVVVAAGGKVTDSHGQSLRFGGDRDGFVVPEFIAWGDPAAAV